MCAEQVPILNPSISSRVLSVLNFIMESIKNGFTPKKIINIKCSTTKLMRNVAKNIYFQS
jgi:hypothetical protein